VTDLTVSQAILSKDAVMGKQVHVAGLLVGDAVARDCRLVQRPEGKRDGSRIVPCILISHPGLFEQLDTPEYWGYMRLAPGHPRYRLRAAAEVIGTIAEASDESFALAIIDLKELMFFFRGGSQSVPV
jgi:hypothetical protein